MFMNVAYLNNSTSTVVDNTKPLIVTSCGNYRVKNRSEVVTHRPKGRKDYQLLYIASGKGHFFIHGEEKTVSAGNIIIYLRINHRNMFIIVQIKPMFIGCILPEMK